MKSTNYEAHYVIFPDHCITKLLYEELLYDKILGHFKL